MKNKLIKFFMVLSLILVSMQLLPTTSHADYHSNSRSFYGVKYDSSIYTTFTYSGVTYNYWDGYEAARKQWDGKAGLSLAKGSHAWADTYYVGSTSDPNLLGKVFPVNGSQDFVGMDQQWLYVKVYIYNNVMSSYNMSYNQRYSNATHEIGHTVKMKHPASYTGTSVMKQGIQSIGASTWDYQQLNLKWN